MGGSRLTPSSSRHADDPAVGTCRAALAAAVAVKRLLQHDYLKPHHIEPHRRRLSIEGNMLYYYAAIGRKRRNIDDACLAQP